MQKYQEQSHILDQIIPSIMQVFMDIIQQYTRKLVQKGEFNVSKNMSMVFEVVQCLSSIRGYKIIQRFMPQNVEDMEPVVEVLHFADKTNWWISYVYMLWLCILIMVPFDIDSIDS